MNHQRRQVLKGAGAAGAVGVAMAAGLLKPTAVYAQSWNQAAFESRNLADVLKAIGGIGAAESAQITVKAPDIAENGAVVPVEITSAIPGTESIAIVGEKNNLPLVAHFDLMNGAEGFVSTRIKLGSTSNVRAVVKAGGKMYTAAKEVKVTIGGCGG
jgi:sulfur-oxidizing protein SoxY